MNFHHSAGNGWVPQKSTVSHFRHRVGFDCWRSSPPKGYNVESGDSMGYDGMFHHTWNGSCSLKILVKICKVHKSSWNKQVTSCIFLCKTHSFLGWNQTVTTTGNPTFLWIILSWTTSRSTTNYEQEKLHHKRSSLASCLHFDLGKLCRDLAGKVPYRLVLYVGDQDKHEQHFIGWKVWQWTMNIDVFLTATSDCKRVSLSYVITEVFDPKKTEIRVYMFGMFGFAPGCFWITVGNHWSSTVVPRILTKGTCVIFLICF